MKILDSSHPVFQQGSHIASGCFRMVYQSAQHKDRVVKMGMISDNKREAELWKSSNRFLRKYLARVYAISTCGEFLVMQKTTPVGLRALKKHLIPVHLNYDAHRYNFGRLRDGRIVMHDYPIRSHKTTAGRRKARPEFV